MEINPNFPVLPNNYPIQTPSDDKKRSGNIYPSENEPTADKDPYDLDLEVKDTQDPKSVPFTQTGTHGVSCSCACTSSCSCCQHTTPCSGGGCY